MAEQRQVDAAFDGCIINISSISAEIASINRGDYCMARAGTSMATKLWAVRLAEFGIRVYEIRPGVIPTDMTAGVKEKYDRMIAEGLTLEPRWGRPEDIGRAVAALARGEFPYATGQVVNIGSVAGKRPLVNRTPYVATKAAVLGLTAALACEVGPLGVIVNCVSPGPVEGERMQTNFERTAELTGVTVDQARADYVSRSALQRMVTEDEVALAVRATLAMPGLCGADIDLSAGMIARS